MGLFTLLEFEARYWSKLSIFASSCFAASFLGSSWTTV